MAKAIPDGYHTVIPYLVVRGAADLIEFMKKAFDAKEWERIMRPDGTVGHAEMRIGDSVVMLSEARGEWQPMPGAIYLYVPDADAAYQRALDAGATSISPPANQFYGDRHGGVRDASGNLWWIATHIEDVPAEELKQRAEVFFSKH
ncbi:VOC family protein [Methylococcus geothermalis]|uniref:VOC family protein n=1 Tax=Methylococcus geothermalis TaxID=2681310 RepID=A0A858Q479_9GAMM|nr:VOC family protein [Methylococcus geothermalis]QJD28618.1 VOC family protein [Methylococcus geothermalis]